MAQESRTQYLDHHPKIQSYMSPNSQIFVQFKSDWRVRYPPSIVKLYQFDYSSFGNMLQEIHYNSHNLIDRYIPRIISIMALKI